MNTLLTCDHLYVLEDIFVPLGICVVLPCLIVFLVMWARRNEVNRKTEVALKAIEKGVQIDPNYFASPNFKQNKSVKAKVFRYLISGLVLSSLGLAFAVISVIPSINEPGFMYPGAIFLILGIAFMIIYFIARRQFASEIKAEEEKLGKTE